MLLSEVQWGQLITLIMLSIALGMDAFSVGLSMGTKSFSRDKQIWLISLVGLSHTLMPWIGIGLGQILTVYFREIANIVGGAMLCLLGLNMIFHALSSKVHAHNSYVTSYIGICFLSLGVSVDSLSAGLSLGFFRIEPWFALLLFGVVGALMVAMGIRLGRYIGDWIGVYSGLVGGVILITLGSKFIW